jgi:hypothetical protein
MVIVTAQSLPPKRGARPAVPCRLALSIFAPAVRVARSFSVHQSQRFFVDLMRGALDEQREILGAQVRRPRVGR